VIGCRGREEREFPEFKRPHYKVQHGLLVTAETFGQVKVRSYKMKVEAISSMVRFYHLFFFPPGAGDRTQGLGLPR